MPISKPSISAPFRRTTVQIAEKGAVLSLDYSGARRSHKGDAWWGLAVGFRAMQVAGDMLSQSELWERDKLSVVCGHPGPGVRDAVNYVTRCVERNRFSLYEELAGKTKCSRDMKYEWWLGNEKSAIAIRLRPDFVPPQFYDLLDRQGSARERPEDRSHFEALKADLEARIWQEPLDASFHAECVPVSTMGGK